MRHTAGLAFVVAAVVFVGVAGFTWRRRASNSAVARWLTVAMLGACWWSVAVAISQLTTDERAAAIATLATVPGSSAAIASFACFAVALVRPEWVVARRFRLAMFCEPLLITVLAATNRWHQLVYSGTGATELTGSAQWSYGPAYLLDTWYAYAVMAGAIAMIIWSWWVAPAAIRAQRLVLCFGVLVPVLVNVVFMLGWLGQIADPTPLGLAVTGSVMAFSIFRHDLFTVVPVTRALIVDQIGDVIVALSPDNRVLDLNRAAVQMIRAVNALAPAELVGARAGEIFAKVIATGPGWDEVAADLPSGRAEFSVRATPLYDRFDRALGSVYVARDVTETNAQARRLAAVNTQLVLQLRTIEQLRATLAEQATRDALTGLHNRRFMVDRFEELVAAAEISGEPLAVVLIDVDRFKAVNDTFGHLTGDAVLVALAQRLSARIPRGALVSRWGGEEFFIALPSTDAEAGFALAEELRRACAADPIAVGGSVIACTFSAGVAAFPASGTTTNDLFHSADSALYSAKGSGRNAVRRHLDLQPVAHLDRG